ncbi:MAG: hypothetical protein ACYSWO_20205 [Planctomycetota bacterium]|jgi:hypothetical protein
MKKTLILSMLVLLVGCSAGTHTADPTSRGPASQRPTVILSASEDPAGQRRTIYEDSDYVFVAGDYGPKGKQAPGLFVFSKKMGKWMEIRQLSTKEAKLGRSPTPEEGLSSVAWDYSALRKADYATIPLMTSGSVNFPDKILYEADTATYLLQFNSSWNIDAVLTRFIIKKDDLDKAFDKQGTGGPTEDSG